MGLQLKHLTPYLPYGLEVIHNGEKINVDGLTYGDVFNIEIGDIPFHSVKPILRPLSDLTKEIKVGNLSFIPETLLEMSYTIKRDVSDRDDYIRLSDSIKYYEELFSWHFDIFNLISKRLAIDINTLK